MLDVPQGRLADDAGMAFSPDSRRFAFSAGRMAKLWDVAVTGEKVGEWKVPQGFQDTVAFPSPDRLLLLRTGAPRTVRSARTVAAATPGIILVSARSASCGPITLPKGSPLSQTSTGRFTIHGLLRMVSSSCLRG